MNHPKGHHHKPISNAGKASGKAGLFWTVIAVISVIFMIGKCSSPSTQSGSAATDASNAAQAAIGNAITTQAPPSVATLDLASVKGGTRNLKKAAIEGLPGEMIYSQNCYDVLGRHFSWPKLDACGAFDMAAVHDLGDGDATGFDKETAWFESETAAGRYLKAAIAAGETAENADLRLSDLQASLSKSTPAAAPAQKAIDNMNEGNDAPDANGSDQSPAVMDT